jgi:hypothetical protein
MSRHVALPRCLGYSRHDPATMPGDGVKGLAMRLYDFGVFILVVAVCAAVALAAAGTILAN